MKDGRIAARSVTAYLDSGAYTRLSGYMVVKFAGHIPGPYTIPNVSADVFCVSGRTSAGLSPAWAPSLLIKQAEQSTEDLECRASNS